MDRNLVDDWFGAFREKDVSKLERALADDFVHSSPFGRISGGRKYVDVVRANAAAFFALKSRLGM